MSPKMIVEDPATQPLTQGDDPQPLEGRPIVVEAIEGPGEGASHRWQQGTIVVGTDEKVCALVLSDRTVSRRHLEVELIRGELRIKDLGSKNGTFLLGARISEARVPLGSTVRAGKTTLRFAAAGRQAPKSSRTEFHGLVGESDAMRRLFAVLERVAASSSTVLLGGETGVGKGAVARAIHEAGPRAGGPFVVFDCSAVAAELFEAELFGHARGAFTGAVAARESPFEVAHRGTLLLDEIGELPSPLQAKLLRVVETREFKRVGETAARRADVRLIAATHKNLRAEARAGRFRADLYHRLSVTEVTVPPLRARLEDVPLLARLFAQDLAGAPVRIDARSIAALQAAAWPGNVRELRNAIERLVALAEPPGTAADPDSAEPYLVARASVLKSFERDYLVQLLERHHGNASAAARTAKLARSHFYRLLARHGLKRDDG